MDAHEVEARDNRALTVLLEREAELVERFRPGNEPAVVGPEPSGEEDGAKARQVDFLGRLRVERRRRVGLRHVHPLRGDDLADEVHELLVALVAPGGRLAQIRCEPGTTAGRADEMPRQGHPSLAQGPEVEISTSPVPGHQDVSEEPRGRARQRLETGVQEAARGRPPDEIVAAHPARRPGRLSAGHDDLASGIVQLLGELAAGLPAADNQHRPWRELTLVPVVRDVQLEQARWQRRCGRRAVRAPVGACGDDDRVRVHVARRGSQGQATSGTRRQGVDGDAFPDGGAEIVGAALQVLNDLVARHEAIRVGPVVATPRQLRRPVGRHEAKLVPAVPPGLTDAIPFQDDVLHTGVQ